MQKFIKVGNERVPVSEEVYREYYKTKRQEKYRTEDVKKGRINVDLENESVTFVPSKEDSVERLMELGAEFADPASVEKVVCDNEALTILRTAIAELDLVEQEILSAFYEEQLTTREIAARRGVAQTNIVRWHKQILEKMRKKLSR